MLASLAASAEMHQMLVGGLIGLGMAGTVAMLWAKFGRQVNLSRFFNVTSVFMLAFAAMLLVRSVYEFTEINLIPAMDNAYWHGVTESLVEGNLAQIASMLLVLAPTLWLIAAHLMDHKRHREFAD
jgi:high-affinity Fe2+/Pb2+ permease